MKIKLSDNTKRKDSEVPAFSIDYSIEKMDKALASYKIISALKSDSDIVIEVNSSLLNLSGQDSKAHMNDLIDAFGKINIQYINKKIKAEVKRRILSVPIEGKKTEGFELFAYLTEKEWHNPKIRSILSNIGVRYYIPQQSFDLEMFVDLTEDDKSDQCTMVIFDNILLCIMGINTSILKKNDIIEMLNKESIFI